MCGSAPSVRGPSSSVAKANSRSAEPLAASAASCGCCLPDSSSRSALYPYTMACLSYTPTPDAKGLYAIGGKARRVAAPPPAAPKGCRVGPDDRQRSARRQEGSHVVHHRRGEAVAGSEACVRQLGKRVGGRSTKVVPRRGTENLGLSTKPGTRKLCPSPRQGRLGVRATHGPTRSRLPRPRPLNAATCDPPFFPTGDGLTHLSPSVWPTSCMVTSTNPASIYSSGTASPAPITPSSASLARNVRMASRA
eukprot:scaffold7097_cov112-Isochrysis_galbana.AAC.3